MEEEAHQIAEQQEQLYPVVAVESEVVGQNAERDIVVQGLEKGMSGSALIEVAAPAKKMAAAVRIEDMDEELLQEQAQVVVEELQRRGACTTLALARMLGMEKSTQLNPLLFLLLEKNIVARVSDLPPIWTLSPTFPIRPLVSTPVVAPPVAPTRPPLAVESASQVSVPAIQPATPIAAAYSPPHQYSGVQSLQTPRVVGPPPQATHVNRQPATIITFPPIPAERPTKPVITFPPIPADPQPPSESASLPGPVSGPLHQASADYWHSLSQMTAGKNGNRNGGPAGPFRRGKKNKNLSELQLRLLKELRERGPTRTLELSKIVGLVACRDVNPSIYDLKHRNLVIKVNNAPPIWQLNEPGMNRAQSKFSDLDEDEDEDESERDSMPGVPFGGSPLTVNPQGQSNFSFFH